MFHIVNQELSLEGDPKAIAEFKAFVKGEVRARKGRAWPGENVIPFSDSPRHCSINGRKADFS